MKQGNRVFVFNMRGKPLMPCTQRKARILLKRNKAVIKKYNPFTIQLTNATGETKQDCHIGIDIGAKNIGIAIRSKSKIFYKAEIELRQDISSNLNIRKIYRQGRRSRKCRYRKARFLNRKRKKSWLPPSLQNRINITFKWIDNFCKLTPNYILHIEVGKFDTAKMINPDINKKDYQYGKTYGFYNKRYYVFARDNYTCQVCGKAKDKILQVHHIIYKSNGGSDSVDNLITICTDCHTTDNHKKNGILYVWQKEHKTVRQFKEPPFMNALRKRIYLKYPNAILSYGYETTYKRKKIGLNKTHYNDAIAISNIKKISESPNEWLLIKQFRKKKRSLHEATARKGRKHPNRTQKRNNKNKPYYKGFFLNDKVSLFGQIGYITGFSSNGAYIKNKENKYITMPNKLYAQVNISNLKLISHNNNWQFITNTI